MKRKQDKLQLLYLEIRAVLEKARDKAYRAVNFAMVEAYWNIGRLIVEEEQKGKSRADYGKSLVEKLSSKLSNDFGQGLDPSNLWNIRKFYLTFPILDALRRELTWTHYRLLLRIEKEETRTFYMRECAESHWSTRQLDRQINSFYHERLLAGKSRLLLEDGKGKKSNLNRRDYVKDPYVLEFLGLQGKANLRENELEQALIDNLQSFLLELGRGFTFVARQQRVSTETQDFYVDLVFYNYILNCFVLIDLKIGRLTHQDIGQMDMYVRIYENKVKPPNAGSTIGIILCSDKDETMVQYSILRENKRLFASKYKLYLPTKEELRKEVEKDRKIFEEQKKLKEKGH